MKHKKAMNREMRTNVLDLARHLRHEHLFVSHEKQQIMALNDKVSKACSRLFCTAWICREQRFYLDKLVSHANNELINCCHVYNALENVHFIDAYKKLGPNELIIAELFLSLRKNPNLLAHCLLTGERHNSESLQVISQVIMSSIYSHCILNEDKALVLKMMKEMICSQLYRSDNPRRLLRYSSCAFSQVYRIFSEEILDAKPFLTAALHEPVIQLLAEDDLFLDIDPNRAVVRFAPSERLRHFGKEGTPLYAENLQKYRFWTINKLVTFVNKFIEGIQNNIYSFPHSLAWIVKELYYAIIKNKRIEVREVGAMCADLVFGFFICPAILNPDLIGITDAHVSHIARFNLMQVAQIIQVLALSKWEQIDPKFDDLYSKFQKDCISSVIDFILEKCTDNITTENHAQEISRSCILISENELKKFLSYLNSIKNDVEEQSLKKKLNELLEKIPEKLITDLNTKLIAINETNNSNTDNSPRIRKTILNRMTSRKSKLNDTQRHETQQTNTANSENQTQIGSTTNSQIFEVIIIPIGVTRDCPGMLSEDKVLRIEQQKRPTKVRMNLDILLPNNSEETESVVSTVSANDTAIEKRTRFSLSQDQESIGTSDNLEAISEAASNHSVESSVDLDNENDNMSDMVSANVSSGRGTPNVSGRDTPSSHSPNQSGPPSSDEEVEAEILNNRSQPSANIAAPVPRTLNTIPITQPNRPNNRDDIEDKFGKFDIKPVAAVDETKSMLSDTWSTDVLASDSEAFEQPESLASASLTQTGSMNMLGFPVHPSHALHSVLDSETASQSDAWSTDVLTSDTERLQEFDLDDSGSVTRSEPDDENLGNIYLDPHNNDSDSPKNGTIKQRNVKINMNSLISSSNMPQEMSENSLVLLRSKYSLTNSTSNALKINPSMTLTVDGSDCERVSFSELTLAENNESSEVFPISLSPTLYTHNMQSLGRLSFDVRKFDDDSTLQSLFQDSVCVNLKANGFANTGMADLLAIDLSQSKNQNTSQQEINNSLIDFEMDITIDDKSQNNVSSDFAPINNANIDNSINRESANEIINYATDSTSEENVVVSGPSVESRFSVTSISSTSTNSSNGNVNEQTNSYMQTDKYVSTGRPINKFASTGAIPKIPKPILSINKSSHHHFGSSDDDLNRHTVNRRGFFKLSNFKSTFREKMRSFKDHRKSGVSDDVAYDMSGETRGTKVGHEQYNSLKNNESSDEILAKYRVKNTLRNNCEETENKLINTYSITGNEDEKIDSLDESELFSLIKRKIRKVLGTIDIITLPNTMTETLSKQDKQNVHEILHLLKVLLAESINLRHSTRTVLLHEAIRSIGTLDDNACQKLLYSLNDDYLKRTVYNTYLTRCRQQLLSTLAYFESLTEHIDREKDICCLNLVSISVRIFLEKKERSVQLFIKKFQSLVAADEKTQFVDKFLLFLFTTLENEAQWQSANEEQLELAKQIIERHVMSQIYIHALYPNGDGDVLRDQILHQHMQNLSQIISPNHKDLGIPKLYHSECPWPSAQAEILALGAYKTPRDKVKCVVRCCTNIMNLLSITSDKCVPAADDLMPVLVYVLIKANPMSLLSTVQYVNSFYDKHFEGEDAYWWTQFCSAIEFIKTMD